MSSFDARPGTPALPAVDERLVAPGTRYEILEGVLVHVSPAHEPQGSRHSKISALLEVHVAPEFDVATDMLTRTGETTDVASDVSVFPCARDPETGGRQLEHLAFEVVSTESLGYAERKAAHLTGRGVRRVFAIDVERGRALEWSRSLGSWSLLDTNGYIEDRALAVSLPIAALVHVSKVDEAMARALLIKRNPVFEAILAEDRLATRAEGKLKGRLWVEGVLEGMAEAVLTILTKRGVALDPAARARILGERDPERLDRWTSRAVTCTTLAELFTAP
jgi:Putative restriction endonuclease